MTQKVCNKSQINIYYSLKCKIKFLFLVLSFTKSPKSKIVNYKFMIVLHIEYQVNVDLSMVIKIALLHSTLKYNKIQPNISMEKALTVKKKQ